MWKLSRDAGAAREYSLTRMHQVDASAATSLLALIDANIAQRTLLFGSLPPAGRDLNLLVASDDCEKLAATLEAHGFVSHDSRLIRFSGATVDAVDLTRSDAWRLPPHELASLLSEGQPLGDTRRIVTPAPHHELLILARSIGNRGGRLDDTRRARIAAALRVDPRAWDIARERADQWGAARELESVKRLYSEQSVTSKGRRSPRPARTRIVSLSGLDGAGKSSQSARLVATLDRLGCRTVTVWAPSSQLSLRAAVNPVRRLLGAGPRRSGPADSSPDFRPSQYPAVVVHAWAFVLGVAVAAGLWRAVAPHLGRGRVVVFDRSGLDFAVFLRYRHGNGRRFRLQLALLRALSPTPVRSYLLDVSGATARRRKLDQYSAAELSRQAELYREEAATFDTQVVDGERPPAEVSEVIAVDAWNALSRR